MSAGKDGNDSQDVMHSVRRSTFNGVKLVGGYQFWSSPELSCDDRSIVIILRRPTLLDMISIFMRFGGDIISKKNDQLLESGDITQSQFDRNSRRIMAIRKGLNAGSKPHK